ncbi:MAG: ATP-binding protein [Candidatus Eremiobacterota bacterium]
MASQAPADAIERLIQVTRSITGVLDQDELLQHILSSAVEFTGAERGFLFLVDPQSPEDLRVRASHQMTPDKLDDEEFSLSRKSIMEAIRTRQRLDRQNALGEARPGESVELFGLRSILVEPMIVKDRLIGVIYLDSRFDRRFTDGHRAILPSFVAQAGICVENARLIAEREGALRQQHHTEVEKREVEAWRDAMSAFVSIASHDLKGPLTVLRNGLFLLERMKLPPATAPVLEDMNVSLRRAMRLVESYLDATALLEERNLELATSPVELRPVVDRELSFLRNRLSERRRERFRFHNRVPEGLRVQADPDRLEQVLGNLLDNAVKYSPEGGEVTVRAGVEGDRAVLEVQDQGTGVAPEVQQRLFQRFVRGPSQAAGTGLGLWIVRKLLETMGGTIEMESAPGNGSTFRVRLPVVA